MLIPLKFKPGIIKDATRYANEQGWFDSNWVRFRMGLPEKMGGWQKQSEDQFLGACRNLVNWSTLVGEQCVGIGTNLKYYILYNGSYVDVTPLRRTVTLGSNPFATTNGSTTVVVTDAGNGAVVNDYVTFSGASGFNNIPAGDLNQEHRITSILTSSTYTIEVDTPANATSSGGGTTVDADYQINVGLDTTVLGLGWGAGTWGRGTWGSDAENGIAIQLRIWSADNFGEDLVANVRNGGLYLWDATNPNDRMVALEDITGAVDAPTVATQVLVSAEEAHVIAFGANPIGSTEQDPMFVRWSTAESAIDWGPLETNSAGGYRLSMGTYIVGATETRSEIMVWTDLALYSMRFIGPDYTFSFAQVGAGTNIIGPNGMISINDIVLWMGHEQFYFYDGRIQPMECPVADYVFNRMNLNQTEKVFAFANGHYNEVGWLYPSTTDECDSYVIYNYKEQAWYVGSLTRTAWLDRGPGYYPMATSDDGYLYDHEFGFDDGSTNPPSPIVAYIESSPMEAPDDGLGQHFLFIDRMIPDVTFRNSSASEPTVNMTVSTRNYPGAATSQSYASSVVQSTTVPVGEFTEQTYIRLRGRSASFRVESNALGVTWRLGVPRLNTRTDGRR